MTEDFLDFLAIATEIGIPIVIAAISMLNNKFRKYGVVILGGCSVWLTLYISIIIEHWFGNTPNDFAYFAVSGFVTIPPILLSAATGRVVTGL